MIALHANCLIFVDEEGGHHLCDALTITVELVGESPIDDDDVLTACAATVKHFKEVMDTYTVTVGEFAQGLHAAFQILGYEIKEHKEEYEEIGLLPKSKPRRRSRRRWKCPA